MITSEQAQTLEALCKDARNIVIVQADNPDADSLASSLALEEILEDLGKKVHLYCSVDMPTYLRYLSGWDRVQRDLPHGFDLSIIVDASTLTLLEKLADARQLGWLSAKPCIVLDHHESVQNSIDFAQLVINDKSYASTGDIVHALAKELSWPLNQRALENIMVSILGDTQGLMNDLATAATYRKMAELIESGVSRPELEEKRRQYGKMPEIIFRYKAKLIERSTLSGEGRIATVTIPQSETNQYSPLYNPAPLIQSDMLQIEGVDIAIVFKSYDDGRVTAAIRANNGAAIAAELAEHFGGGGHPYASGFKVHGKSVEAVRQECIAKTEELLRTSTVES